MSSILKELQDELRSEQQTEMRGPIKEQMRRVMKARQIFLTLHRDLKKMVESYEQDVSDIDTLLDFESEKKTKEPIKDGDADDKVS